MDKIEKSAYEFVNGLITDQINIIQKYEGDNVGELTVGLFENKLFSSVVIDLFGNDYFRETKLEIKGDDKWLVLNSLNQIVIAINNKL
jgi:hypothetical protein